MCVDCFFLHIYIYIYIYFFPFLFLSLLYLVIMVMVSVIVFNATFNNISIISGFYWWRKPEYPEKTTELA